MSYPLAVPFEVAESDFTSLLAEAEASEKAAQTAYDKLKQENAVARAANVEEAPPRALRVGRFAPRCGGLGSSFGCLQARPQRRASKGGGGSAQGGQGARVRAAEGGGKVWPPPWRRAAARAQAKQQVRR